MYNLIIKSLFLKQKCFLYQLRFRIKKRLKILPTLSVTLRNIIISLCISAFLQNKIQIQTTHSVRKSIWIHKTSKRNWRKEGWTEETHIHTYNLGFTSLREVLTWKDVSWLKEVLFDTSSKLWQQPQWGQQQHTQML